jgi:hypothetical protein
MCILPGVKSFSRIVLSYIGVLNIVTSSLRFRVYFHSLLFLVLGPHFFYLAI